MGAAGSGAGGDWLCGAYQAAAHVHGDAESEGRIGSGDGVPAAETPTKPTTAGFAATRNFAQQENTNRAGRGAGSRIRAVGDIAREYWLGEEVMRSLHRSQKVVFATHAVTGADVVIKVRSKNGSFENKEAEHEWRSTTEYMMSLAACSNIAKLYEVLEDDDAYYVVMEKVSGQDLFESIAGRGPLPTPEIKEIVAQILAALVDLHKGGRIHKDLKLENVMLDRTPASTRASTKSSSLSGSFSEPFPPPSPVSVKLIDFDTVGEYCPETPRRMKDVLGTDQYIAQEAYDGNYSPASDIFAVGVIAYRLCTGRFPFSPGIFDDKPGENWVGSPKMKEIQGKLRRSRIRWGYKAFEEEPEACDLLYGMLATRELDRPSAVEALAHPWLASTSTAVALAAGEAGALPDVPNKPLVRPPTWFSEEAASIKRQPVNCPLTWHSD